MNIQSESLWIERVVGSRNPSNFGWASILLLCSVSFLLAGFSSYLGQDIVSLFPSKLISFFPQGLVMCFYGIGGLFVSLCLWSAIFWDVGSGYNEFDRKQGSISLFRWGFPGKNRRIRIRCSLDDVQTIKLETRTISSYRAISLRLKNQQDIPLNTIDESLSLIEIEEKAAELARFLRVSIEGL